ncbi:MAG: hypothetical protein ACRD03_02925 [Acidimicrobiales bacterium]
MPRIIPRLIPICALIFGVACNTDTGEEAVAEQQSDETDDVTIASCGTDSFGAGTLAAQLSITNNSSKRSNYSVEVSFESVDGATQHGTGIAFIENVEPGQTTTQETAGVDQAPATEYTCRVVSVDRSSDVG